jgi:hypothetical protein
VEGVAAVVDVDATGVEVGELVTVVVELATGAARLVADEPHAAQATVRTMSAPRRGRGRRTPS